MFADERNTSMKTDDIFVTDVVLQALRMDDTIKKQEVIIVQLKKENSELYGVIEKMKGIIHSFSPELGKQFELFQL